MTKTTYSRFVILCQQPAGRGKCGLLARNRCSRTSRNLCPKCSATEPAETLTRIEQQPWIEEIILAAKEAA